MPYCVLGREIPLCLLASDYCDSCRRYGREPFNRCRSGLDPWLDFFPAGTPPHPEYPSGHSSASGAAAAILAAEFGNATPFTVTSDVRPGTRAFPSFPQRWLKLRMQESSAEFTSVFPALEEIKLAKRLPVTFCRMPCAPETRTSNTRQVVSSSAANVVGLS